jgi:tRNA (guanine37-N1)-methyltransferase
MPKVGELAAKEHLLLISGHYESVDERFRVQYVDEEISIGDYVLTNGTLPAAVLIDAIVRTLPGALGDEQSLQQDSFHDGLLSFPQYTRPEVFEGKPVPSVLLSGDHAAISQWRLEQQMIRTIRRRSGLIFN